jgi:hypothetical protein
VALAAAELVSKLRSEGRPHVSTAVARILSRNVLFRMTAVAIPMLVDDEVDVFNAIRLFGARSVHPVEGAHRRLLAGHESA